MKRAFSRAFGAGADRVVLVGTDCPEVTVEVLVKAFQGIEETAVVLGPARDGGYYLIGLTRVLPELFEGLPWGTPDVWARTQEILRSRGIQPALLPTLVDVDRPEDLPAWEHARRAKDAARPRLSVIIPALNEETVLPRTLEGLRNAIATEVIVADGGSTDRTLEAAARAGVRSIISDRGRGAQANAGARAATGEALLFLHADTRLPRGFDLTIRCILDQPGVAAGAFRLGLDAPGARYRRIERWANRRARWFGLPYGDQGLFLRRELFERIEGFPEQPIMEDFDLVRKLRRFGRIVISPGMAMTSARRWERLGAGRTFLINQGMFAGRVLGVSLDRLARWYRRAR